MPSGRLPLQYGDTVSLWLEDESGHVWADGHVDGRCSVRTHLWIVSMNLVDFDVHKCSPQLGLPWQPCRYRILKKQE